MSDSSYVRISERGQKRVVYTTPGLEGARVTGDPRSRTPKLPPGLKGQGLLMTDPGLEGGGIKD